MTARVSGVRIREAWRRWWFEPVPLARVAWLRAVAYVFVVADVLVVNHWVVSHGDLAGNLYHPLLVGRLLHLPTPTHVFMLGLETALAGCAAVAATGRAPRLLGTAVLALYLEWLVVAFSYGKVDHDEFAFVVLLAVLPTLGRAGWRDSRPSDTAGWAVRCVQVAVVCTYFLSTWAKFRYGGFGWLNSATLVVAVVRKGNPIAMPLLHMPWLLRLSQWGIVAFELSSPVILFVRRERVRFAMVAVFYAFHVMTMVAISIVFLPHCVAVLAFLPLERLARLRLPHGGQSGAELPSRAVVPGPRRAGNENALLGPST